MKTGVRERVRKVFREVFDDPDLTVSDRTTAADVSGWDSLNHINLIIALEEEFGIQFTTDEIASMACVGDLYSTLDGKVERA